MNSFCLFVFLFKFLLNSIAVILKFKFIIIKTNILIMEIQNCYLCQKQDVLVCFSCEHNFCSFCIHKVILYNQNKVFENFNKLAIATLECPICKQGDYRTSKDNLSNLITSTIKEKSQRSQRCNKHRDKSTSFFCKKCNTKLCHTCLETHEATHLITNSLNELDLQCSRHSKRHKYRCITCGVYICQSCREERHEGHDFKYIISYREEMQEEMRKGFPWNSDEAIKSYVDVRFMPIKARLRDTRKNIIQTGKELIEAITELMNIYKTKFNEVEENIDLCHDLMRICYIKYARDLEQPAYNYMELKMNKDIYFEDKVEIDSEIVESLNEIKHILKKQENAIKDKDFSTSGIDYVIEGLQCHKIIEGFFSHVTSLVQLKDGTVAAGLANKTILLCELKNDFEPILTLHGHKGVIWSVIQLKNGDLASTSEDKTIRIWDQHNNYKCSKIIEGHLNTVWSVIDLADNRLITCSGDKSIRIWNTDYSCFKILRQHSEGVRCIINLKDEKFASGSYDKTIRIWEAKNEFKCLRVLEGHTSPIYCLLQLRDGRILSGSGDKTIRVWKDYKCEKIIEGHKNYVWSLCQFKDGRVGSGSGDCSIRIWDIGGNFSCSEILSEHSGNVWTIIQLKSGKIVSGSLDRTIRIWQ
jgi:WD40 repeat protein